MLPPPPSLSPPSPDSGDHRPLTSLLITGAILLFAVVAVVSIHFLLRFLSLRRRHNPNSISPVSIASSPPSPSPSPDPTAVIQSLPLFTLSSNKSPPLDCSVCLSPFEPREQLRLLPSCRHVFHSECIDAWLGSTLTCPLCRGAVDLRTPGKYSVEIDVPPQEKNDDVAGDDVANGSRSWLREYVERIATSASSSFSWMRGGGDAEQEEEYSSFYRWLVGT